MWARPCHYQAYLQSFGRRRWSFLLSQSAWGLHAQAVAYMGALEMDQGEGRLDVDVATRAPGTFTDQVREAVKQEPKPRLLLLGRSGVQQAM
eukprot:8927486-Pyramimonas_sp.AAC.1